MKDNEIDPPNFQSAAPPIKVSVLIGTYNQEQYIAQAVNSVLMQEVDFFFEIVISEDCSTDRTRQIVLESEQKSPDKIRVLLCDQTTAERDRSLGIGGKSAFVSGFHACRGQYVALLDGDDFWTSKHKLQKQVDFLERHPDFAICFHNAMIVYEQKEKSPHNMVPPAQKEITTLEDLLKENFMPTSAVMFRNRLFGNIPAWFYRGVPGDWFLHILNAEHGPIGYIDEVMSVYRRQPRGAWTTLEPEQELRHLLQAYELIDEHLPSKYHEVCSQNMRKLSRELSYIYLRKFHDTARGGRFRQALPWLKPAVKYDPILLVDPWQYAYFFKSCILSMRTQLVQ